MKLRTASPDDHDTVVDVFSAAFRDYANAAGREPGPYPWLPDALRAGNIHWLETEGHAVGACWLVFKDGGLGLEMLAIHPDHQRAGHGTAALKVIEAYASAGAARFITLYTMTRRTHLVVFYSRQNFRVWKVAPPPHGRDDLLRVHMTKTLI
ncbi:MAG: GNAT family N-acetyltransferase [Pseudomonadota bacterium]